MLGMMCYRPDIVNVDEAGENEMNAVRSRQHLEVVKVRTHGQDIGALDVKRSSSTFFSI